jgi:hypothetical protein
MLNSSRHVSLLQAGWWATAHVTPWQLAVGCELGFVEPEKCGNVRISGPAPLRFYSSNFRHSNAIGQKMLPLFFANTLLLKADVNSAAGLPHTWACTYFVYDVFIICERCVFYKRIWGVMQWRISSLLLSPSNAVADLLFAAQSK